MRHDLLDLELPKLRKARQITEAEHDGAVYWPEALVSGDLHPREYFSSIDELREACEREGVAVPLWVWPCSGRSMKVSAKQILERELDNGEYFEDADVSPAETEALQALLGEWAARADVQASTRTYTVVEADVIVLHQKGFAALLKGNTHFVPKGWREDGSLIVVEAPLPEIQPGVCPRCTLLGCNCPLVDGRCDHCAEQTRGAGGGAST